MNRALILALRVVIACVIGGTLFVQTVMIPMIAINSSDIRSMQSIVITVILVLALVTVQIAAVCFSRLVTLVKEGTVFSNDTFRYVDVVIGDATAACVLALVLAFVVAPGDDVPPGMVLLICGIALVLAGIALLVLVLRELLSRAVDLQGEARSLRGELEEVI